MCSLRVPSWCTARAWFCLIIALGAVMPLAGYAQQPSPPASQAPPPAVEPSSRQIRTAEKAYAKGVRAMEKGDVDAAEKDFAQAVKADPSNRQYSADLEIAQQHRVTKLVQDADKARLMGQPDVARAKLAEALALDPKNPEVSQHIYDLAHLASTASPDGSLDATFAPAIQLTPKPGKQSFHFRSTGQAALRQVLEAYGMRMVDDGSLGSQTIRFDVDDVDFAQAAHLVNLVTHTFMVPLDPVRVLVAKDTKENHDKYDRLSLETLYLPGLTPTEFSDMSNIAKNVLGVQQATAQPGRGYPDRTRAGRQSGGAESDLCRFARRQERGAAGCKNLRGGEHQDAPLRRAVAAIDHRI